MQEIIITYISDIPENFTGVCKTDIIGCSTFRIYMLNGKIHREDGPAYITADGIEKYYLNGKEIIKPEDLEIKSKEDMLSFLRNKNFY